MRISSLVESGTGPPTWVIRRYRSRVTPKGALPRILQESGALCVTDRLPPRIPKQGAIGRPSEVVTCEERNPTQARWARHSVARGCHAPSRPRPEPRGEGKRRGPPPL